MSRIAPGRQLPASSRQVDNGPSEAAPLFRLLTQTGSEPGTASSTLIRILDLLFQIYGLHNRLGREKPCGLSRGEGDFRRLFAASNSVVTLKTRNIAPLRGCLWPVAMTSGCGQTVRETIARIRSTRKSRAGARPRSEVAPCPQYSAAPSRCALH